MVPLMLKVVPYGEADLPEATVTPGFWMMKKGAVLSMSKVRDATPLLLPEASVATTATS